MRGHIIPMDGGAGPGAMREAPGDKEKPVSSSLGKCEYQAENMSKKSRRYHACPDALLFDLCEYQNKSNRIVS